MIFVIVFIVRDLTGKLAGPTLLLDTEHAHMTAWVRQQQVDLQLF